MRSVSGGAGGEESGACTYLRPVSALSAKDDRSGGKSTNKVCKVLDGGREGFDPASSSEYSLLMNKGLAGSSMGNK